MAVAQLIETLDAGGAEALAVDIANALADRGMDSHLIVIDGGGKFQNRVHKSVSLHDLKSPRCLGRIHSRMSYFAQIHRRLAGIVKTNGIEVVQTHLPKANFFGLSLAALGPVRVHPTVHNNREFDYGDNPPFLIKKGRRTAYWMLLRVSAEMIAVSADVKAAMAAELGVAGTSAEHRIVSVPNGVDCTVRTNVEDRERVRGIWKVHPHEVLLVAAGRMTRQKNFASLISALEALPAETPPWKCIVGGEGELWTDLETQIEKAGLAERIRLPGHVDNMQELMGAADVFCLSSLFEGLPLVMLEAMASALPICAFEIPGVSDVITDGLEGVLVRPGDESHFAAQLAELVKDQDLRQKLGRAGRQLVQEKYNFSRLVDDLVRLYRLGPQS